MLTAEIQDLFVANRLSDKPSLALDAFQLSLNENQYANIIINIMTYCEELGISKNTTFLAKVYLDIVLTKSNFIEEQQLLKVALCCVWMAVKFNQSAILSTQFSPEILCQQANYQFEVEDITSLEIRIFKDLNFKLCYTTPYDVMHAFFTIFPWHNKIREGMPQIFDLVMTLPSVSCQNSENIFYSSFLALCHIKGINLDNLQKNIVESHISEPRKVRALKQIIIAAYDDLASDDMDGDGEVEMRGE